MTGVEHQSAISTVEIVLNSSGLVLKIDAANGGDRLVSDVCEGASLQAHIHPDDYQGFLWSTQGILNGSSRQQIIQVRWARSNGRWSKVHIELSGADSETVLLAFRRDEVEQARRAEAQFRRIVEGASAYGIVVRNNAEVLYQNDAFAHLLGFRRRAKWLPSRKLKRGPAAIRIAARRPIRTIAPCWRSTCAAASRARRRSRTSSFGF